VVVAAMVSMMTWWLASGRARQVRVMWQNSRCSILFHLEVPPVILSFRVSRGCDLRRPVVDSVADGTLAA
jgi:hypothetical protein